jgi:hypothetical protein
VCDNVLELGPADAKNYRALLYLAHGISDPARVRKKKRKDFSERYKAKKMKLLQDQGYLCYDCDRELWIEGFNFNNLPHYQEATFEHIIPYRYGSSMSNHNLVILCGNCNQKRNKQFDLDIIEDHFGPIDWDALRRIPIVEITDAT